MNRKPWLMWSVVALGYVFLYVPIVSVIIGEGGSGGALALGVADRVLMLEHTVYSVISPEGCAAILWDDPARVPDAAVALRMTAKDLREFGIVDDIVPEPIGGAHRDPSLMGTRLGKALAQGLQELQDLSPATLIQQREVKYRAMGRVSGMVAASV